MKLFYSTKYNVENRYPTDTYQKSKWLVDSLTKHPMPKLEIVEPKPLTLKQLKYAHTNSYINYVRGQEDLWNSVIWSNGGMVSAVKEALVNGISGTLSSGLHHARRNHGAGFCTFNGLAIAAIEAVKMGLKSVMIIDADAHCGGGTASIIKKYPQIGQLDLSVCSFDEYSYEECPQARLEIVKNFRNYIGAFHTLLDIAEEYVPELVIYNSGMDCHESDTIGGLRGIDNRIIELREKMIFNWCATCCIPIAFTIAGGYTLGSSDIDRVVRLHRITIDHALGGMYKWRRP